MKDQEESTPLEKGKKHRPVVSATLLEGRERKGGQTWVFRWRIKLPATSSPKKPKYLRRQKTLQFVSSLSAKEYQALLTRKLCKDNPYWANYHTATQTPG